MQKINFITPIVFETSKLKTPAIRLAKSIFAFNHAHLKLYDQIAVSFLPLNHLNFMRSFRNINPMSLFGKTHLPTDILTYWKWWNRRTPFCLKAGVQNVIYNFLDEKYFFFCTCCQYHYFLNKISLQNIELSYQECVT